MVTDVREFESVLQKPSSIGFADDIEDEWQSGKSILLP
jgi:hypothetical protein